jgi:opacity protein-like surface antigen
MSVCLSFIGLSAYAQRQPTKLYAELSIGPSFPVGKFASKDYQDTSAGFANTGVAASISLGYRLNNKFSLLLNFGGSQHGRDAEPIEKRYGQGMSGRDVTVTSDKWKAGKIMAGGRLSLPISSAGKVFFTSDLLAGVCKTAIPEYSGVITVNNMLSGSFMWSKISLPWSFSYQVGAGVNYNLNGKIYLLGHLSYFDSRPVHHTMRNTNPPNFAGPYVPVDIKYSLSSLNFLLGAGIGF